MAYFFFAQISIQDYEEYQKYLDGAGPVFQKYNGTYLAIDQHPTLLESSWANGRVVLIQFASKQDFENWYNSHEYQDILKHRLKAATCNSILISGL